SPAVQYHWTDRLAESEPLADGERLWPAVRLDSRHGESGRHPPGIERELARQHVVDHLATLSEGRLDKPPQLVLGHRVESIVSFVGLDDDHRGLDRRLRREGAGRD